MSSNNKSPLLEYTVKELKEENINLKDKIDYICRNEIKKREELLKLQSTALEIAANGIVITDANGKIKWVNTAFTELTGYSKEDAYNQNPRVLKSGVHGKEFYKNLWDTISSGSVWRGEMVNKRKDGTLYTEEMTITPLLNEKNEVTNFIAIKHNITDRKENHRNLLINHHSVEQSSLGIIWVNTKSQIIYANKTILKNWNYTSQEALALTVADIDPNFPNQEYFDNQIELLRQSDGLKFESVHKRKDGSTFNAEVSLKFLNYENEEIIVAYIEDISVRFAIREIEKLVLSNTNLDELLLGMHNNISKVIPAPNCYIALLEESTNMLSFPYFVDQNDPPPLPRKMERGSTEYVINIGKPLLLNHERCKKLIDEGKIEAIGTLPFCWIGIPIIMKSKSVGALVLQSYDENLKYCEKNLDWLSSIVNLIASSIERKQYENEILENEKKIKAITNSTKDAIITVDEKTNIILWNNAAEKLFGFTEEEALGKSTFDLIIPARFREESEIRFKKVTGIGKDFKGTFNLIAKKKDGTEFEVELSISLTEINNNWYSTGIWRDFSKKKEIKNSSHMEKEKIIAALQNELTHVKSNYNILNTIINVVPQRIYVKDQNSRFIKVNKSIIEGMGLSSEKDILGKTDRDFFSSSNAKEFLEEETKIMKTGIPITNKEHAENLQNGQIGWASTSKFPLYNSEGKSIGTFGITTDLTNRKKTEDELNDSHYKFRQLIENSTLGIIRTDENGEIIMINPAMVKMLAYNSETEFFRQKLDRIYFSLNNRKKLLQILKREEKVSGFEDTLIKQDGSLIDVRQSAWAVRDKNGKIIYYEIIIEDITEHNLILKVLHESEFKYRMLIDKLSEAIYLWVDGKFEIVNSKFLELFELSEEELYSADFNISKYMPNSNLSMGDKDQGDSENVIENTTFYETTIITEGGIEKDVEVSLSYLNYNGKVAAQGVVRDLTVIKKQETQIRHLQKMESIGTLAAGIAHEINTPSQFVSDNLSFLKDSFKELKPILVSLQKLENLSNIKHELSNIVENADLEYLEKEIPLAIDQSIDGIQRISNIVGAMRDFAHTGPKDKISADIHKIIRNSITLSKNAWKYIAEINTNFGDDIPLLECQPNDINQVIVNMIVNSSHAMEEKFIDIEKVKGKIEIQTGYDNSYIIIKISDNGAGMPEKVIKRIFDPFYTTKEVGKGTGQGLAIAYDIIVTKHGGDIEVSSEVGLGTQFIIKLPVEQSNE